MGLAERGEAHREAWRSLSRREIVEIIFPLHYQPSTQKNFAELCSTLHFVEVPKILAVSLHCQSMTMRVSAALAEHESRLSCARLHEACSVEVKQRTINLIINPKIKSRGLHPEATFIFHLSTFNFKLI